MARIADLLLASVLTPIVDVSVYNVHRNIALSATVADDGDYAPVLTMQRSGRIIGADLAVDATLGAGATVKLALYRDGVSVRDLTGATTAAAASLATSAALGPIDVEAGDEIVLVFGGANVSAAANADIDVRLQH